MTATLAPARLRAYPLDPLRDVRHRDATVTADDVSAAVREWCRTCDPSLRVVICGYDDEHDSLGWAKTEGKAGGGAGYSTLSDNGRRERLWYSLSCLSPLSQERLDFGGAA